MIGDYKNEKIISNKYNKILSINNDFDSHELLINFFQYLFNLDQIGNYSDEVPIYQEIINILSSCEEFDFSIINSYNPLAIFQNFVSSFINQDKNIVEAVHIISLISKALFKCCGEIFIELLYSSPLCFTLAKNLNNSSLSLFAITVGISENFCNTLKNYELPENIITILESQNINNIPLEELKIISLFLSNYTLKCNISDFIELQQIVQQLINIFFTVENDEISSYCLIGISRALSRSDDIANILVAKDIIQFLNKILFTGDEDKIKYCLTIIEILTNHIEIYSDNIKDNLCLKAIVDLSIVQSDIGRRAINCIINILNLPIFSLKEYIESNFPEAIEGILNNGSLKMKKGALQCIANLLLTYEGEFTLSTFFSDSCLQTLLEILFEILDNIVQEDYCQDIIFALIKERKIPNIDEFSAFIQNLILQTNDDFAANMYNQILILIQATFENHS